jgi:CHAT domain-containing protein
MNKIKTIVKKWVLLIALGAIALPNISPAAIAGQTIVAQQSELAEAQKLNQQAIQLYQQGRYADAIPLVEKALAIREKLQGSNHLDVAATLYLLSALYSEQGNPAKAESLLASNLAILNKAIATNGDTDPKIAQSIAQSLNDLAALYADRGNYAQAEEIFKRVIVIKQQALGREHPSVAFSQNNLGLLYLEQEKYQEADAQFQQALELLERVKQKNPDNRETSIAIAQTLSNLGSLYLVQKNYDRAEKYYQNALEMRQKILGEEHPGVAPSLGNLANLYSEQGKYQQAEPIYQKALAILEKTRGAEHPEVGAILKNLSLLYWSQGNIAQAISYFSRATNIEDKNIALILSTGSEAQKRSYMDTVANSTDLAISLHLQAGPNNPEAACLALTNILQRKGRILDALTDSLQSLRQNLTPEDRKLLDELNLMRSELAALIFRGAGNTPLDEYRSAVATLKTQLEKKEATLARRSANFRIQNQSVTIAAIQKLVPDSAALVEISQYRPYNPQNSTWGNSRYVAYVLQSQGEPQSVDLGDAQVIDKLVDESRKEMISKSPAVKQQARALDAKLMQPIRQLLGNKQKILLSPDSQLNLMPFTALVDENDRYLVENYAFSYVTTGRDLLRFQNQSPSRQPPVILADPDYDLASDSASAPVQNASVDRGSDRQRAWDLGSITLKPLPGTAQEARAIAPLLPGVTVLTQDRATENALKQVRGPNILHIATHGFFLKTVDLVASANYASGSEISSNQSNPTAKVTAKENPLLRSGIGLAGFNPRQSGSEDGVVTALEAAGLDLQGTKLVVLSACETGLGEVAGGEGVYGLRRALVMAGSESQLISLWQVDDFGTMELMSGYYRRLSENESRSEALRQTQLKMLQDPKYQHPYFWAAFIPSGDWRTMNLSEQTQTTQPSQPQSQPSPDGRLLW